MGSAQARRRKVSISEPVMVVLSEGTGTHVCPPSLVLTDPGVGTLYNNEKGSSCAGPISFIGLLP